MVFSSISSFSNSHHHPNSIIALFEDWGAERFVWRDTLCWISDIVLFNCFALSSVLKHHLKYNHIGPVLLIVEKMFTGVIYISLFANENTGSG